MDNPKNIQTSGIDIQKVYWKENLIWDKNGSIIPLTPLAASLDFQIASDINTFDFSGSNIMQLYYKGVAIYNTYSSNKGPLLVDVGMPNGKTVFEIGTHISAYPYLVSKNSVNKDKATIFILAKSDTTSSVILATLSAINLMLYTNIKQIPCTGLIVDFEMLEGTLNGWILYVIQGPTTFLKNIGSAYASKTHIAEILQYSSYLSDYDIALTKAYLKNKWFNSGIKVVDDTLNKSYSSFEFKDILISENTFTVSSNTITQVTNGGYKDMYTYKGYTSNPTYTPYKTGYVPKVGTLNGHKTMIFDNTIATTVNNAICLNDKTSKAFTAGPRIMYAVFKVAEGLPTGYTMPIFGGSSSSYNFCYDTTNKVVKKHSYTVTNNGTYNSKVYHKDSVKKFEDWSIVIFQFDYNEIYNYTNIGLSGAIANHLWLMGEVAEIGCYQTINSTNFHDDLLTSLRSKYGI